MSDPVVAVVISTRNRRDELRQAIISILAQTVPAQLIVMDDGSTDGTDAMVRDFPDVQYYRFEGANGPCVLRNRGTRLARAPVVVSIDDDAFFPSPLTLEQVLHCFTKSDRIGAVAMPFINVRQSDQVLPDIAIGSSGVWCIAAYTGAARAVRRDLFCKLDGYRESLYYMGEESDLCVRLLAAGFATVVAPADPLHHTESPRRDLRRADYFGHRNLFLFAWMNAPTLLVFPLIANNFVRSVAKAIRCGRPFHVLKGTLAGLLWIALHPTRRAPIPLETFRLFRQMRSHPEQLNIVETFLAHHPVIWRTAATERQPLREDAGPTKLSRE